MKKSIIISLFLIAKGDCPHKRIPPLITDIHYTHSANLPEPLLKKSPGLYIYTFSPSVRLPQMSNRWHREKIFHVGNFYCGAALHCSIVTPTKFLEATTASSHNAIIIYFGLIEDDGILSWQFFIVSTTLMLLCCSRGGGHSDTPTSEH